MDRRQRKTRAAILEACIDLMKEKDFQHITVGDIARRANINRGTFYLHFADKYDMLDSFENEMAEKIERAIVENIPQEPDPRLFIESRYDTIVQILTCFQENRELLNFLLKCDYASFQAKLRSKLRQAVAGHIFPQLEKLRIEIPLSADLFVVVFTSIMLSLAEYAYRSQTFLDVEQAAKFIF
jgi:AcrR family transcriptional regulator